MELPINYDESSSRKRKLAREEYIKLQNGTCCHCRAKLSGEADIDKSEYEVDERLFPPNFFKWPIHLHHDHSTGVTIGAVHAYCNAVLWQYHGE